MLIREIRHDKKTEQWEKVVFVVTEGLSDEVTLEQRPGGWDIRNILLRGNTDVDAA